MDLKLQDKTALVTGASAGIGRAIAKGLAAEGVHLCLVGRREEKLREVASEIVNDGGKAPNILVKDSLDEDAAEVISSHALAGLGRVDILSTTQAALGRLSCTPRSQPGRRR
jgi:3-oxoacyl-[acyl-carrier protein] reductase